MPSLLAGYTFGICQRPSSPGVKITIQVILRCEWMFKMIDELLNESDDRGLLLLETQ